MENLQIKHFKAYGCSARGNEGWEEAGTTPLQKASDYDVSRAISDRVDWHSSALKLQIEALSADERGQLLALCSAWQRRREGNLGSKRWAAHTDQMVRSILALAG